MYAPRAGRDWRERQCGERRQILKEARPRGRMDGSLERPRAVGPRGARTQGPRTADEPGGMGAPQRIAHCDCRG